jgi:hypothetical protein
MTESGRRLPVAGRRPKFAEAAEALGLSRRQVAYYASGEHEVPRTVLLACKGWEVERQVAA